MLNSLKQFFKTRLLIILLGATIILLALVKISTKKGSGPTAPPTPLLAVPSPSVQPEKTPKPKILPSVSWRGITAGQNTQVELEEKLGKPETVETKETFQVLSYPSGNKYRPHTIILSENKVAFIKEQIIDQKSKNLKEYIQKYGQPDEVFYSPLSKVGYEVYGYLKLGLAVNANPNDGIILEIWYFTPTDSSDFLKHWGGNLSKTPPRGF